MSLPSDLTPQAFVVALHHHDSELLKQYTQSFVKNSSLKEACMAAARADAESRKPLPPTIVRDRGPVNQPYF
jgi:hypothetical protein